MDEKEDFICNAKIAGITSSSEVAINVGESKIKDKDMVYAYRSVEITDPDTSKSLGKVRYRRLTLAISLVAEKYSIATVEDFYAHPIGGRRRKLLTDNPLKADDTTVLVSVGEEVSVFRPRKKEVEGDETAPPF